MGKESGRGDLGPCQEWWACNPRQCERILRAYRCRRESDREGVDGVLLYRRQGGVGAVKGGRTRRSQLVPRGGVGEEERGVMGKGRVKRDGKERKGKERKLPTAIDGTAVWHGLV